MSIEDYAWLAHSQDFKCAACKDMLLFDKNTHLDHCHSTGKIRGILCNWCNLALGHSLDSIDRLKYLVKYLSRFSGSADNFDPVI